MNFDELTDRRGTHCFKWDRAQRLYEVPQDCLPMWIADHDFRLPDTVLDAGRRVLDHGIIGYGYDNTAYEAAIGWWHDSRHGWTPEPGSIFTGTGLCNGIALCIDTYTKPGDGIIVFSPVYTEFASVIRGLDRNLIESEMIRENGRYTMDLEALDARMTGNEKALLFCSPHNPVGRVWAKGELNALADFVRRHDLLLMSDEIHQDIVFPGARHIPMTLIDGLSDRLIMLTAPSKTFSMPGMRAGNIIVQDPDLRAPIRDRMKALSMKLNNVSATMFAAAYTPEGAAWTDAFVDYLDGNRSLFEDGVKDIPGLAPVPIEGTFLTWVDFSGTGMAREEFIGRVERDAGIAASHGTTFGPGGETFLRFNIGTQRARIEQALDRLGRAFRDLQQV